MVTLLLRKVGRNTRYYKLFLSPTLFGDFLVEKEYGNIKYKAPTGIRKYYFLTLQEAKEYFKKTIKSKIKKGYKNGYFKK